MTKHLPVVLGSIALGLAAVLPLSAAMAADPTAGLCPQVQRSAKPRHIIFLLDVSYSFKDSLANARALARCALAAYGRAGDELTVLSFGADGTGRVDLLGNIMLGAPQDGNALFDQARTGDRLTRTYFARVVAEVNARLATSPVDALVIILSDRKSDAHLKDTPADIRGHEVPFSRLGQVIGFPYDRDLFAAINGHEAEVKALAGSLGQSRPEPAAATATAISPCLISPHAEVQPDGPLILAPSLVSREASGTARIRVRHECAVSRPRRIEVLIGGTVVASRDNVVISQNWQTVSMPVTAEADLAASQVAVIKVGAEVASKGATLSGPRLEVRTVGWWQAHGFSLAMLLGGALATAGVLAGVLRLRYRAVATRPFHLRASGAQGPAKLRVGASATIGGDGCDISFRTLPANLVAARVRAISRERFELQPTSEAIVEVNGAPLAATFVVSSSHAVRIRVGGVQVDTQLRSADVTRDPPKTSVPINVPTRSNPTRMAGSDLI